MKPEFESIQDAAAVVMELVDSLPSDKFMNFVRNYFGERALFEFIEESIVIRQEMGATTINNRSDAELFVNQLAS